MLRRARCWVCGALFEAERGSLPRGALFTCARCTDDGLAGKAPDRKMLARVLYARHGVPFVEVDDLDVFRDVLAMVPEDFARHHAVLPIGIRTPRAKRGKGGGAAAKSPAPDSLVVAIADPGNVFALESLRRRVGLPIVACVAPWSELQEAIATLYTPLAIGEEPIPE